MAYRNGLTMGDPRHGTATAYTYWGCRCNKCVAAATLDGRQRRADRFAALRPCDHGKYNTYINAGCRCDKCRAAYNRYRQSPEYKEASRRRRLQRLAPKIDLKDLA